MNDNTKKRYALLYQSYGEVVSYYGELSRFLTSGFLIKKASERCNYSYETGKKILSRISGNATLRKEIENILRYDLPSENGNE